MSGTAHSLCSPKVHYLAHNSTPLVPFSYLTKNTVGLHYKDNDIKVRRFSYRMPLFLFHFTFSKDSGKIPKLKDQNPPSRSRVFLADKTN